MALPKIKPYNYVPIYKALNDVKDCNADEATMLTQLHDVILEYSQELSSYLGALEYYCIMLSTAKGRLESGFTDEEAIMAFSERKVASTTCDLVDKTYFLITQKAKLLLKKT